MKSAIYRPATGAATRPIDDPNPDIVETVSAVRPMTSSLMDEIMGVARLRVVNANAKFVFLYYWATANHGDEKLSLRAAARNLNMPWATFRRAREELTEAHLLTPILLSNGRHRIIVNDPKEVVQNEPVVYFEPVVQNEPPPQHYIGGTDFFLEEAFRDTRVSSVSGTSQVGQVSLGRRSNLNSILTTEGGLKTPQPPYKAQYDALIDAFGPQPPLEVPASPRPKKFALKPPRGPNESPPSARRSNKLQGRSFPVYALPLMYEICFGATRQREVSALGKVVRGRVTRAILALVEMEADISRLREFYSWWKTWASGRPSPESVVSQWLNAMEQIEEGVREANGKGQQEDEYIAKLRASDAEWTPERLRELARRRAKELGNPLFQD
jgi:hypothetical protein